MKTITKDNHIFTMSKNNVPSMFADSGETIVFETLDALANKITNENQVLDDFDWNAVNPATGPLFVNGTMPGDILKVKIQKIEISNKGVLMTIPNIGPLPTQVTSSIKIIEILGDKAIFNEKIQIPLNKMIGVIGTAPKGNDINCGTPCLHGGNMDCIEVKEGATIYLPVNVKGALLAIGDLHAAMADGEVGCTGIEVSGKATITVEVIKGDMPTPFIENETHVMTLYSDEDLNVAADMAVRNMHSYLTTKGFTPNEAAMLLSIAGDTKICQIVDPKKTCRVQIKKKYI